MLNKNVTFLKILLTELDDLEEKVNLLLNNTRERFAKGEISNYVFLENCATQENQILRIKHLAEEIKKMNPWDYDSPDDIINNVLHMIQNEINKENLSEFSIEIIRKKMEKIKNYVETE